MDIVGSLRNAKINDDKVKKKKKKEHYTTPEMDALGDSVSLPFFYYYYYYYCLVFAISFL